MPRSIECPNCGGSLPAGGSGTVTCTYCGSSIQLDGRPDDGGGRLPPEAGERIADLLRSGNKIEAIKVHRQYVAGTLKESKQAVEGMARELGIAVRSGSCSAVVAGMVLLTSASLAFISLLLAGTL